MAYNSPATAVTGDVITAAFWNTNGRDNILETAVAKVTNAADMIVATGPNALKRVGKGTALQVWRMNAAATDEEWATLGTPAVNPGVNPLRTIVDPPANVNIVAWNPQGTALAVTKNTTPFLYVYPFDPLTGTFGAPTTPPVAPASDIPGMAWSPDGAYLAVAVTSSPFIQTYPWNGTTIGAVIANPGSLPAGQGSSVAFSPNGNFLALGHATTPFVSLYAWTPGAYGAKTVPGVAAAAESVSIAWSPTSLSLVVGHGSTPYITAYPISAGGVFGTIFRPAVTLPGQAYSLSINAAGTYLAIGCLASPYAMVYPYSDTAIGTRVADPATLPPGQVYRLQWWEFGGTKALICVNNTSAPYWTIYEWTGSAFGGIREWDFSQREIRTAAAITLHTPRPSNDQTIAVNPATGHVAVALQNAPYLYVMAPNAL